MAGACRLRGPARARSEAAVSDGASCTAVACRLLLLLLLIMMVAVIVAVVVMMAVAVVFHRSDGYRGSR